MLKHIPFYATLLGRPLSDTKDATHSHVLVYGAIEAHSFGEKGCIASNDMLAKETGLKASTIKVAVSEISTAGWVRVEYRDAKKQRRGKMVPLLEIAVPLVSTNTTRKCPLTPPLVSTNTTVSVHEQEVTDEETVEVTSLAGEPAGREKAKDKSTYDPLGADIINAFAQWNPAAKRYYGNTTQRRACDDLLVHYGLKRTLDAIAYLEHHRGRDKYIPTITNPHQLFEKWLALEESASRKHAPINTIGYV